MRILITDSFCSSNRGDAAILDGMITGFRARGAEVGVVSHFPGVAHHFHGIDAVSDQDVVSVARAIRRADLVVSCGGSFLHDIYAKNLNPRLATMHLCRRAGVPYAIFGQSIGPLVAPLSRMGAREVLDGAAWIGVRDPASAEVVRSLGVGVPVYLGVDAAVLGIGVGGPRSDGPTLGVTVRHWHFPGANDAPAMQAVYERDVAAACRAWVAESGGEVRFLSNCTGFGGYAQDDRVAARRVAANVPGAVVVEADDLGFAEVRGMAGACDFFLGTRMHSLIFATTAGVPAVGIAYEFKTGEWMESVGLGNAWVDISDTGTLAERVVEGWRAREESKGRLATLLPAIRTRANEQFDAMLATVGNVLGRSVSGASARLPGTPSRVPTTVASSSGWNGETWKYDVAHRRLRTVADVVLAEGGENVLDLGCSTGMLGRMLGPAYRYEGIDIAPSVATANERFTIRTGALDTAHFGGLHDVVVASGSLEYVSHFQRVLLKTRAALKPGGLAVLTLYNLAHIARGLGHGHRHRDWKFDARPDDLILALHEVGLRPTRILASSAGYCPPSAVNDERPTEFDLDGGGQLGPDRMVRLAHHWVVVCRAGEAQLGPSAMGELAEQRRVADALRIGVDLVRMYPWAARAWADLGVLWHLAGRMDKAVECLSRAVLLDPGRAGARHDLLAMGRSAVSEDAETALLLEPGDSARWRALEAELLERGRLHSARAIRTMADQREMAAAK